MALKKIFLKILAGLTLKGGYLWRGLERSNFRRGKVMISTPEQKAQEEGDIYPLCHYAVHDSVKIFMVENKISQRSNLNYVQKLEHEGKEKITITLVYKC